MFKNNIDNNTSLKLKVENGKFIHLYDNNAIVMHYVFGYKLNNKGSSYRCGFPKDNLYTVVDRLEDLFISYEVNEDKNVLRGTEFKDNDEYLNIYKGATKQLEVDKKIDLLIQKINCLSVNQELEIVNNFLEELKD